MKILLISDKEAKYIWDFFDYENFKDIDFIISAGDLNPSYLSFIVTMLNVPLFYVHGNHDQRYKDKPPLGCQSIEDDIITYKGIRIMGLGGSFRYNKGDHQYTEKEMRNRADALRKKLFKSKGIDILVTHSAPECEGNLTDIPHRGFTVFRRIIEKYRPSYHIHGHDHLNYSSKAKRVKQIEDTTVINAYNYYILEYEPNKSQYERNWKHLLPFININHFK